MARATAKKSEKDVNQTELLFEPKRDINPYWSSSLFSDVYLKNDFPREYAHLWRNDENSGFTRFYQGFVDLCVDLEGESFKSWREADTVKNWIVPVMDLLGWENNSKRQQNSYIDNTSFTVEENGKKQVYRPDLIYFDRPEFKSYTQDQKEINEKLREIRSKKTGAQVVVEAKYWDRLSAIGDKVKKSQESGDSASSLGPELQTLKYMELFHLDYGVLTDGKTWKLLHRELSQGVPNRSFEFDLGPLMELALKLGSENNEAKFSEYAKYFYYFFSKESFCETKLLDKVLEYSKKYASRIEEDLKERFIVSMGVICNSLKNTADTLKIPYNLELIRNVAESHLFNILFVKSCEVRHILPVKSPNYIKISLHEVIESLSEMEFDPDKKLDTFLKDFQFGSTFGGKKFDWDGFEIFDRFINLYEIIHDGTNASKDFGFEIQGFKESIFSSDEWKFAKKAKICNEDMVKILFNLNFIKSEFPQRKYQQIPYSYFTPRQLGSIYESFLEFKLKKAPADLIFNEKEWKEGNPNSRKVIEMKLPRDFIVKKGDLFFDTDNIDRKMTGSYYTPDHVVNYIIENSISPLLKNIKSSKQLLELKVCDPAMGSGHFLSGVLDYLTKIYREMLTSELLDDLEESFTQSARLILDSCIFGVDLNPRAVKLAKMSLWLSTAESSRKLENLDDQLKIGNSLTTFQWKKEYKTIFQRGGFDVVIQNPPYIFARDKKLPTEDKYIFETTYKWASYQSNTYTLFIEKAHTLLRDGGSLGAVVPNNWMTINTCKDFRKGFLRSFEIHQIVNCYDKLFENASVDNSIIVSMKKHFQEDAKVNLRLFELRNNTYSHKKDVRLDAYDGSPIVMTEESKDFSDELFDVLESSQKLGDNFQAKSGLKAYEVGKGNPIQSKKMKDDRIYHSTKKHDKTWRPYLEGKDVCRYFTKTPKEYIKYGSNLAAPRTEQLYRGPRILIRQIPSQPPRCIFATFVDNDYVNDLNSMIISFNFENDAHFVLAILNSELISKWFIRKFDKFQRKTFPQFKVNELNLFPIPDVSVEEKNEVVTLSKSLQKAYQNNELKDVERTEKELERLILRCFTQKKKIKKAA
jgi:tRNA1(Val) A37 N6-methylase TrmN6